MARKDELDKVLKSLERLKIREDALLADMDEIIEGDNGLLVSGEFDQLDQMIQSGRGLYRSARIQIRRWIAEEEV